MAKGRSLLRWLSVAVAVLVLLALVNAYGRTLSVLVNDLWGPDFSYYDNGRMVQVKLHRLIENGPAPGRRPGPPPGPGDVSRPPSWAEKTLRAACLLTLNLMGLAGPEGGLWTAAMEGQALVARATATGAEVGRYRVTEGTEDSGLVAVELQAGPNGLHLMDVVQPVPGSGWFVVQVYHVPD